MNKTLALFAILASMLQASEKNDTSKNTDKNVAVVDKESHDLMGAELNELKAAFFNLKDISRQQKESHDLMGSELNELKAAFFSLKDESHQRLEEIEKLKAENAELKARFAEPAGEGPKAAPLKGEDIPYEVTDAAEIWLSQKIRRFKNVFEMSPSQIKTFIKGFQYAVKQAGNNATFAFNSDQDEDIRVAVNGVNQLESYGFTVKTIRAGAVTISIGDSKATVTISKYNRRY